MTHLSTQRLRLRLFSPFDKEFLFELDNDPEVMKYLTNGEPTSLEEIEHIMSVLLHIQEKHKGRIGYWMAVIKETNDPIGWFHLRPRAESPKDETVLELGYRLKKEFWGQGYATEMGRKLIDYGFTELKTRTVCAHTMLNHLASQGVMKKLGMTKWYEDTYEDFPGEDKRAVWFKIEHE